MLEIFLPTSPKRTMEGVGVISGYPTYENLITFKCAKALTRKIRHKSQRESWIKYVSSITSSTNSQQLWRKVKVANGLYRDFTIPILVTSTAIYSSPVNVSKHLLVCPAPIHIALHFRRLRIV
ncbi:putative RNA-directed DNA polymerase from transposon X-element [Trichonephila clavipes]|nr:putative RNA-directed DNA polymerase from transposon X-element [Trichonephila clavipes]